MLSSVSTDRILFIDIETVPQFYQFDKMPEVMQTLWTEKTRFIQQREEKTPAEVYEKAGVYAEFGKVICISLGYLYHSAAGTKFRITSFAGKDEHVLLQEFTDLIDQRFSGSNYLLCGHNIKEFDIPYLCRRMLVSGIRLPDLLDLSGKKPWEVPHLDTMELWKFGDYKHYTSLNLLTHIFGIPTPKDDISGADVARVFYEEDDIEKIVRYCEKDVVAVAQLLLRMKGEKPFDQKNVVVV